MSCTFETLESRRLLAGWAPASLEGWGFSCAISDGSYPYAEEGQFQFWPATSGNRYQLIGGPGVANSSGTYSYTRTGDNTGRFLISDSLTGLSASQTLAFTAPTTGVYQLIGNGGFQNGTFTVLSMPPPPPAVGTISGSVFADLNGNYNRGAGEAGWAGAQVFLDSDRDGTLDVGEAVVSTDASGAYTFTNVSVGSHLIRVQRPTDNVRMTRGGFGVSVHVQDGAQRTGVDFGLTTRSLISGIIFNDANSDNRRGAVETGRAGVRVYLDSNGNGQYAQAGCSPAGRPSTAR